MSFFYDKYQEQAIKSEAKKILVISGAGGGKTGTLIGRINFLIDSGVPSEEIAAITYTNIAAQEMRKRINPNFNGYIGTIHSLASAALKDNNIPSSIWYKKSDKFNELLNAGSAFITKKYNYILVDEMQDITDNEYEFIKAIDADSYFFVGDDWQSLYEFRGANEDIFFDLIDNEEYSKYYLINNYRSKKQISQYGYNIISNLKEKKIDKYMNNAIDGKGNIYSGTIFNVVNIIKHERNYKEWMILCRLNKEVEKIQNLLSKEKIPYDSFKKSNLTFDELEEILEANTVKVLTIHSAKGLECENVAVYKDRLNMSEQEIKVAYVAATRAKTSLYLCSPPLTKAKPYAERYLNIKEN